MGTRLRPASARASSIPTLPSAPRAAVGVVVQPATSASEPIYTVTKMDKSVTIRTGGVAVGSPCGPSASRRPYRHLPEVRGDSSAAVAIVVSYWAGSTNSTSLDESHSWRPRISGGSCSNHSSTARSWAMPNCSVAIASSRRMTRSSGCVAVLGDDPETFAAQPGVEGDAAAKPQQLWRSRPCPRRSRRAGSGRGR